MASQIVLRDPGGIADPNYNLGLRWANTTNTPLVSVTDLDNGKGVADIYSLAFTKTGGVVTCDVTPAEGSKSPYGGTGLSVTADGVTANTNLVPGTSIVVSASTVTGWAAKVSFGAKMTSAGATTDRFNPGVVEAGMATTGIRVAAVNVGGADSVQTTVDAVPSFYWTQAGAGNIMLKIDNDTDDTREHLAVAGTKVITFVNWQDGTGEAAGYKTCDVYVGGAKAITTAVFDGVTRYQYGVAAYDDGANLLSGLSLILANSTDSPAAVTITLVTGDGDDWVELATDTAGSPGTYQTAALVLTEAGQVDGTVRAGCTAYFWFRWNLPDDATPGDIRQFRPSVRGLTV